MTRLSGSGAERLSHGDVAHSWGTDGLSVIEGLNPPGGPGKGTETGSQNIRKSDAWVTYDSIVLRVLS